MSPTYSVCKNHGYLTGEQFTCPECGEPTEVYSRITGYYRPVGNWNAGKTEEYKHRKEYVIDESSFANVRKAAEKVACEKCESKKTSLDDGSYLFVSATCPNCKIACAMLDKAEYKYTKLLATDYAELVTSLGIKQAPTLVVVSNGNVEKYAGAGAIKGALDKLTQANV